MAYAAAVYLLQILKQLQQSDQFSSSHYPKSQIHHLQDEICFLKDFLENNSSLEDSSESTNDLESRIRDAIYKAEDIIELHISPHCLSSECESASRGEENHMSTFFEDLKRVIQEIDPIAEDAKKFTEKKYMSIFSQDLQRVIQEIDSIAERTKKFKEKNDMSIFSQDLHRVIQGIDSIAESTNKFREENQDLLRPSSPANRVSSRPSPRREGMIVGRYGDINQLVDRLRGSTRFEVVPIVGISGIGKTALAKAVFDEQLIKSEFKIRAWVKISLEYHKRDILLGLLRSMEALGSGLRQETDDQLEKYLIESLQFKKYLIVLDDICDVEAWNYLKELLPDDDNGSRVVLTTTNMAVARFANNDGPLHEVHLLSNGATWDLLRRIVFGDESCPPKLEQIAEDIARDCKGLPLAIVMVGRVLANAKSSVPGWQTAASSISTCGDYGELIKVVLSLTYRSLPQCLKACLLYMGIFPGNCEIPVSKLIKLWIAEGFLELNGFQTLEEMAEEFLLQLVDRSLISGCKRSSTGRIKTCMINDVFRNFVKGKAKDEKFFHVINKDTKGFLEDTDAQRRLGILKNIRLGIKDVTNYNSNASVSTARSLLYSGPKHQHPLRAWLNFKLLRVLDALNIRFYSFPLEILKLVQLRYLAFTCNGEVPASVCKLWNLQFLIVLRHLSTKHSGVLSHLPMEIWNMKELRHLQIMGRDLPDPTTAAGESDDGNTRLPILGNLLTLSDVSSHSCTPEVLQRIPNLNKLGIRIESPALDAAENFSFLNNLRILHHLESLNCVVVRPHFGSQVVSSVPYFPPSLKKLCLSGCGFSWEYMKVIAALQNLEVLKLQNYSFRGSDWELNEEEFIRLKFLLLEDMDVENWVAESANFPSLTRLIIRHCYKLREIPYGFGEIITLQMIELDDCNPSVVESVRDILELQREFGNDGLQVLIPFSGNNHKFKPSDRESLSGLMKSDDDVNK